MCAKARLDAEDALLLALECLALGGDVPDRTLHLLCGHSHSATDGRLARSVRVTTGGAEYGVPALQPLLRMP